MVGTSTYLDDDVLLRVHEVEVGGLDGVGRFFRVNHHGQGQEYFRQRSGLYPPNFLLLVNLETELFCRKNLFRHFAISFNFSWKSYTVF